MTFQSSALARMRMSYGGRSRFLELGDYRVLDGHDVVPVSTTTIADDGLGADRGCKVFGRGGLCGGSSGVGALWLLIGGRKAITY